MNSFGSLVVGAMVAVSTPSYGFQDLDSCRVSGSASSAGTVESVRVVPVPRDLHAFDEEALEHKVAPDTAEELVVRLDVGPVVIFTEREPQRVRAGQRVRVTLGGSIVHVALESECAPLALGTSAQRLF